MKQAGFTIENVNGEEKYVMQANAEAWPKLMGMKTAVENAVKDAKGAPVAQPAASSIPSFANMPGLGGNNQMGQGMQNNAAANLFSNPEAMTQMLQNPAVQQMMQNDPRMANNPALRQSMQQLASNPAMMNQLTEMMRNPNMQSQMQSMMRDPAMQAQMQAMMSNGGMGGMGGTGGFGQNADGSAPPPPGQQANTGNQGRNGGNDQQQTEEEMIAEAIRRSLEQG